MPITVTSKAATEILRVLDEQQLDRNETVLRLGVQGGGCSGVSYSMTFSKRQEINLLEDVTYNFDGLSVAVSRKADSHLEGTTVDFLDSLDRRGFTFDNPNVNKGCGTAPTSGGGCGSGGCGSGGCGSS